MSPLCAGQSPDAALGCSAVSLRRAEHGGLTPPARLPTVGRRAFWFLAVALTTLPLFAHGCHRGDHDDEPLFVPLSPRVTDLEPRP